jgi:hypothetical protein
MHEMLKTTFNGNAMARRQTFGWFSRFKHRETSVEDREHSCHPSISHAEQNVEKVHKIINED